VTSSQPGSQSAAGLGRLQIITTRSVADGQVIDYFRVNSDLSSGFPH